MTTTTTLFMPTFDVRTADCLFPMNEFGMALAPGPRAAAIVREFVGCDSCARVAFSILDADEQPATVEIDASGDECSRIGTAIVNGVTVILRAQY